METKAKKALNSAQTARKTVETWVDLHNAVFGINGTVTTMFTTKEERITFCKTPEFREIQKMINDMRESKGDPEPLSGQLDTASGYLTVRLPKAIHAALIAEAKREGISLNQLCSAKLCVQLSAIVA